MLLTTHSIRLPVFEGPLDLLLQLIERQELDITAVSLAQVADQYLAIIEDMGQRGLADLTAFLVVAARLVLIKSRVLLPGYTAPGDDAESVAADLVDQLEIYRRFKEAAQELARREEEGLQAYVRLNPPFTVPAWFDLEEVVLEGLLAAAQEALDALPASPVEEVISPVTVTVGDQIALIQKQIARCGRVSFRAVLSRAASRLEVIVTLMAVLELLKQDRVRVLQEGLFGPIFLEKHEPEPATSTTPEPSPV
jgi:segregation and condensation protein A